MEISLVFQEHPDENVWEEYVFGRLKGVAESRVEEHLLVCSECQSTLARTDEFIRLTKFSMRMREQAPAVRSPARPAFAPASFFTRLISTRVRRGGVSIATALAAAALAAAIWMGPYPVHGPPISIDLHSLRGGAEAQFDQAPAGHPLDLSLRSSEVPPSQGYRLEVVNAGGTLLWSGAMEQKDSVLSVHIDRGLRPGLYWVKLYSSSSEELAEYGLKLQ